MIRSNLAVLLAEKNLRITTVSKDTGISRTTLTDLSNNYCKGIQLETLNRLCLYLRVTPEDILSYFPYDITVESCTIKDTALTVLLQIRENQKEYACRLGGRVICGDDSEFDPEFDILVCFHPEEENNNKLRGIFQHLPRPFLNDLELDIQYHVAKFFDAQVSFSSTFSWDDSIFFF